MATHTWGEYPQGIWTLEVCEMQETKFVVGLNRLPLNDFDITGEI